MTAQSNPWIFPIPVQDLPAGAWAWSKGRRYYEFKDHRSNVYVVVTDLKLGQDTNNDATQAEYYFADVQQAQDYYAFGMIMPGRNYDSPSYRYGYNGKEKDDEVKGSGNWQDYGMRCSDTSKPILWSKLEPSGIFDHK